MRVVILCEFSGVVRDAFIRRGHDAVSCDYLPTESDGPHIQGDCLAHDWSGYDLAICHPPCTYLCSSGAGHFDKPGRRAKQLLAIEFVRAILSLPVQRIALENPIGVLSKAIRKPDQIIQPWQFGNGDRKATCLWLDGLPLLRPTLICRDWSKEHNRNAAPAPDRWKLRSRTYPGIAAAMAQQWGDLKL